MKNSPLQAVRARSVQLAGDPSDYDALLELTRDRQLVLLGEASHGTREFYRMRAEITRRLIREQGFEAIAVEADWPDAWRVNACVRGVSTEAPHAALADFERFPRWMWRNSEVLQFVSWLREANGGLEKPARAGFYGLDLYSLYRSAELVVEYLDRVDPEQAQAAREGYACLDHVADAQGYGYQAAFGLRPHCRDQVISQLVTLKANATGYVEQNMADAFERQFHAERNAAVVANAEQYYRAMFSSRASSWNLRDEHMTQTLLELCRHLRNHGSLGKVVVWAHNSHIGDARATQMGRSGELNLGQLVRSRLGDDKVLLVGFTTFAGHVTAAGDWDSEAERMQVRPGMPESYEALFHRSGKDRFYLELSEDVAEALAPPMLERAIGVVYRPVTERRSHYLYASLPSQFDAVFHLDETDAVEPLDASPSWRRASQRECDETFPSGL